MQHKIDLQLNEYNWHVYLRDEADSSVFNEIFKFHEYRIADEVIKNAKDPIVDVGAHAGFFTLHARSLNKKVSIFAIEPEPQNLESLRKHLKENKILGVQIVEAALAGETGERKLFLSEDSHNHSVVPPVIPSEPSRATRDLFGHQTEILRSTQNDNRTVVINTLSFSDLLKQNKIKKVSLLKMDIEGGEYEVFDSMSEADLSVVNYVILEYHISREKSKEIEEKLRTSGFGVQIFPSKFDKTMGFIYANNKRFSQ